MHKIKDIEYIDELITFENDGYELTPNMKGKYDNSIIGVHTGQIKERHEGRFCKNASIFDVTGLKLTWGDITPNCVNRMLGVYYILSEMKSFFKPDENYVKGWLLRQNDPNSRSSFYELLPNFEPVVFDISYVKKNAFARILNGKIQSSEYLIFNKK